VTTIEHLAPHRLDDRTGADAGPTSDPALERALPGVSYRLRRRFPTTTAAEIETCIDAAVIRSHSARVRGFLPILVERWAAEALVARGSESRRIGA
jgi:hypothetical protein